MLVGHTAGHNTTNLLSVESGEAIAPGLRVKWGPTPGQAVLAGDEPCLGICYSRTFGAGEGMLVLDIRSTGTLPFTAGGAIAKGDEFSSAAGGKVVSGTGGSQTYGVAFHDAQGDGSQFAGTSG